MTTTLDPGAAAAPGSPARIAPLWAVCVFSILNSVTTTILTNGVFFLAREAYGFGTLENYALGMVAAGMYIAGALAVGPALARACQRYAWLSHRAVLCGIMLALSLVCCLPWAAAGFSDNLGAGGSWAIWVLAACQGPLSGAMWPIVESYLAGGRRGAPLRHAIGTWNILWSLSGALSFWLMGPLVEEGPRRVLAALAMLCLGAILVLPAMGADPGRHLDDDGHEVPPVYERLLAAFRVLLPMSYFVISALSPNLPVALERLGVHADWRTPLAATWMVVRVPAFILLARWHGWHGKWWMATAGAAFLGNGFALAVLGPVLAGSASPVAGIILLEAGLAMVGLGMAMVYVGALYYVSAARHSAVGAGGSHEALIGAGYVAGPACGLAASGGVAAGVLPEAAFAPLVLGLVGVVLVGGSVLAWRKARSRGLRN